MQQQCQALISGLVYMSKSSILSATVRDWTMLKWSDASKIATFNQCADFHVNFLYPLSNS